MFKICYLGDEKCFFQKLQISQFGIEKLTKATAAELHATTATAIAACVDTKNTDVFSNNSFNNDNDNDNNSDKIGNISNDDNDNDNDNINSVELFCDNWIYK